MSGRAVCRVGTLDRPRVAVRTRHPRGATLLAAPRHADQPPAKPTRRRPRRGAAARAPHQSIRLWVTGRAPRRATPPGAGGGPASAARPLCAQAGASERAARPHHHCISLTYVISVIYQRLPCILPDNALSALYHISGLIQTYSLIYGDFI